MTSKRQQTDWALLRRVGPYLRENALLYGVALLCAPISAALVVAQPWLLKHSIDEYLVPGDVEGLKRFALYYLAAVVFGFVAESLYTLFMSYAPCTPFAVYAPMSTGTPSRERKRSSTASPQVVY